MKSGMIYYTLIIPHKDIPKLLERCLVSIPQRDDVQVIIVDDNSDPEKTDFAAFPGLGRKNTEVYFTKEGKGAGYARNIGLSHAKGKWLVFADADDFFNPCFGEAMDLYKEDENDIIFFKATSVDSETGQMAFRQQAVNLLLDEIQRTGNKDLSLRTNVPWGKFIKRSLITKNNIQFQNLPCSNDVLFNVKSSHCAKKIIVSDLEIYCVTQRNDSLTTQYTMDSLLIRFQVACDACHYLKTVGKANVVACNVELWLTEIYKIKRRKAFYLIPTLIKSCGFRLAAKCIKPLVQ
jgi:glycosyltransferase involved in cell wall biosynthesis